MGFEELKKEAARDRVRTIIERMLNPNPGYSWERYTGDTLSDLTEAAEKRFREIMEASDIEREMADVECGEEPCDCCDVEDSPVEKSAMSKLGEVVHSTLDNLLSRKTHLRDAQELNVLIAAVANYNEVAK